MSAPSPPPDNSMQVEQMRQDEARRIREEDTAKALEHKNELTGLRTNARSAATGAVGDYFLGRGVNADKYAGGIAQQLNNMLSGISPTDENPGQAFANAGATIYDTLQTGERTRAGDTLNKIFAPNFEMQKIPTSYDDPFIAAEEESQYNDADKIIRNMLDRGILTSTGYQAAADDLNKQRPGARVQLNKAGTDIMGKEWSALTGIANKGRQAAGNINLGDQFDPYTYQSEADQSFNDFISSFGDQLHAALPGKLFSTTGLAALGGAAQGPTNTAYDPKAAAGIIEDDKNTSGSSIFSGPNKVF